MLRNLFILLILSLPATIWCQSLDTSYNNQVKLSVLRYINILNPAIEISYERLHGKRFSSQLSLGSTAGLYRNIYTDLKGYSLGFEEKYFFRSYSKDRKYFSFDFNYTNINYKDITTGKDTTTNTNIIDSFTIRRKTKAVALKYGVQVYRKHFVLDMSIGAGVKYKNVKHYDRSFEYKGPREFSDLFRAANVEMKRFVFIMPVTLTLGYRF
jgi:putative salt-induced outer membrane protein YdiY